MPMTNEEVHEMAVNELTLLMGSDKAAREWMLNNSFSLRDGDFAYFWKYKTLSWHHELINEEWKHE